MTFGDLPPSSKRDPLEIAGRSLKDKFSDFGRTGKRDLIDIRMRRYRASGSWTEAGNDVDHSIGHSRLADQLSQPNRGKRSLLGRLQDQSVAESQGWRDFPTDGGERTIPGNNLAANADRLAQRVVENSRIRRIGLAVKFRCPARVVAERVSGPADLDDRLPDRLSVVERYQLGKFVSVALNQIGDREQVPRALMRSHRRPFAGLERVTRRLYGFVHIGLVAFRDQAKNFLICRIDRFESFP